MYKDTTNSFMQKVPLRTYKDAKTHRRPAAIFPGGMFLPPVTEGNPGLQHETINSLKILCSLDKHLHT